MSRTIHKYEVSMTDEFTLSLPTGAEVLSIQIQNKHYRLWAVVDPIRKEEKRTFIIRGTGHPLPDRPIKHIATVQQELYVWHFFEVLKPLA